MSRNTARRSNSDALEDALGHSFRQPELLDQALTHASSAGPGGHHGGEAPSNERLEFLGDRVLGLTVAELLYERFPAEQEGALARRHALLVSRASLARVAERLELGAHLRLSRGEEDSGGRRSESLLADACEAVIAALYLDGGLPVAAGFVRRYWEPLVEEDHRPPLDAKTALQEWAQGRGLPLPAYRTVGSEGPAHQPRFEVEVAVTGHAPASASGPSKRQAERAAAEALLQRIDPNG